MISNARTTFLSILVIISSVSSAFCGPDTLAPKQHPRGISSTQHPGDRDFSPEHREILVNHKQSEHESNEKGSPFQGEIDTSSLHDRHPGAGKRGGRKLARNLIRRITKTDAIFVTDGREIVSSAKDERAGGEGTTRIPSYMADIYREFSGNRMRYPKFDTVRSFQDHEASKTTTLKIQETENDKRQQNTLKNHTMIFNISLNYFETIVNVELRFFPIYAAVKPSTLSKLSVLQCDGNAMRKIGSKLINTDTSYWEIMDVTDFIKPMLSLRKQQRNLVFSSDTGSISYPVHFLIRIEALFGPSGVGERSFLDISHDVGYEPLLVVYSTDSTSRSKRQENAMEIDEIIQREQTQYREEPVTKKSFLEPETATADLTLDDTRHKRSLRRNFCRRHEMKVNFDQIGWDGWIVFPREYHAYRCEGECYFPLASQWTPTKHAIVQTLVHDHDISIDRASCVPTRLEAMSILYLDENGVPTYKYAYEGMIVKECGCR